MKIRLTSRLDAHNLTIAILLLVWMIALTKSKKINHDVEQFMEEEKWNVENNELEKFGERKSQVLKTKTQSWWRRFFHYMKSFTRNNSPKGYPHLDKYKYISPMQRGNKLITTITTTEFIPDDPEGVTDPATRVPHIVPSLDMLNPPVRMPPNASFKNGTICRLKDESGECWNNGNCRWYEICKTVNCLTSCHRREREEWKLAIHNPVGLYLRSVIIFDPKLFTPLAPKRKIKIKSKH